MRLSRFVHIFDLGDEKVVYLWHALKKKKLFLPRIFSLSLNQSLLDGSFIKSHPELYRKLVAECFLCSEQYDQTLIDRSREVVYDKEVRGLVVMNSLWCNLHCPHCLLGGGVGRATRDPLLFMSSEVAKRAIDYYCQKVSRNNRLADGYWEQVTFYGGEPFANFLAMQDTILYLNGLRGKKTLWENISITVNTNGTLITKEIAQFLYREKVNIQLSLDGFREAHNGQRPKNRGKGSFDDALRGLANLLEAGVDVLPLITITMENYEELPSFIVWLSEKYSIQQYGTNLLVPNEQNYNPSYPIIAGDTMLEMMKAGEGYDSYDESFRGVIRGFGGELLAPNSCGGKGRKITVFPDGEIHSCQVLKRNHSAHVGMLGSLRQDEPIDIWRHMNRFNNEECLSCPVIGSCGGGCPASALNISGDINSKDEYYCLWIKTLFKKWFRGEVVI